MLTSARSLVPRLSMYRYVTAVDHSSPEQDTTSSMVNCRPPTCPQADQPAAIVELSPSVPLHPCRGCLKDTKDHHYSRAPDARFKNDVKSGGLPARLQVCPPQNCNVLSTICNCKAGRTLHGTAFPMNEMTCAKVSSVIKKALSRLVLSLYDFILLGSVLEIA